MKATTAFREALLASEWTEVRKLARRHKASIMSITLGGDDEYQESPIHWVAKFATVYDMSVLLNNGGNVNIRCQQGYTPLHMAASYNRKQMLAALVMYGAELEALTYKDKHTPLLEAVITDSPRAMRQLLSLGANPEYSTGKCWRGTTALIESSLRGHLGCVRALLDHGVDVDRPRSGATSGHTALLEASTRGHWRIVDALASAGADVNLPLTHLDGSDGTAGTTALIEAAGLGNVRCVERLIAHGADVNAARGGDGDTALLQAVWGNHTGVVDVLLASGVDVDRVWGPDETTALHLAAEEGHGRICKRLVLSGADLQLNARDLPNSSPLDVLAGSRKKRDACNRALRARVKYLTRNPSAPVKVTLSSPPSAKQHTRLDYV